MVPHKASNGTILVVDDTPASISMVRAALEDAKYRVLVATSGEKALQRIRTERPDLILLDILMPGMDGYETCRRLKADAATRDIPVIFLSALADTFDKVKGFELGAVDYLIKPMAQEELLARVHTHLSISRLEQELQKANEELETRVEQRTAELAATNVRLEEEIEVRKRAEEEILQKKDELYKAYEELTAFDEELKANFDELSRVEKELRLSEEYYRILFENTGTATVILEEDTTISLANTRAEHLTGYSREELVGRKRWTEFVIPEDLARVKEQHRLRREKREDALTEYEFRLVTRTGEIRHIFLNIDLIPGTKKSVASLMDITERKKAEDALRESEERFRALYDENPSMYLTLDPEGTVLSVNQFGAAQLGYSAEELIGRPVLDLFYPEDKVLVQENLKTFLESKGKTAYWEFRKVRKDGTIIWVAETVRAVQKADGSTVVLVVCENITEWKMAKVALERATRKLNLLNAITFTDIQAGIFSLHGYLELEKTLPMNDQLKGYIDKQNAIVRAISDSLKFAKKYQDLGLRPPFWQNAGQVFLYAISHMDPSFSSLSRRISVEGLGIFADPLLEDVFFALAENVARHGKDATEISLYHEETPEGLTLIFEDNGIGIPIENKETIFEKRSETKRGMGLFLSREILSITGISIKETSEPGKGARFAMLVPKGAYRFTGKNYGLIEDTGKKFH